MSKAALAPSVRLAHEATGHFSIPASKLLERREKITKRDDLKMVSKEKCH